MDIDDTTKVKIWQDMYKQAAWERDVAIKQLEQLGYELGEKIEPDQFRDPTKKTDFKSGDKFILELGAERRMFGEFEIKGTDLYVKTDLLEKLTRYKSET